MKKCFCGFDHSQKMSFEEKIIADLYHDLYQRAMPNSDDEIYNRIRKLQRRLTKRMVLLKRIG